MTYMKMTRGPESSTSLQPLASEQPARKKTSIKNSLLNLSTIFVSMLLALMIVMNLIPSGTAPGSISFDSVLTLGQTMIAFLLTTIIYGMVRLLQAKLISSQTAPEQILKDREQPTNQAATKPANSLLKLTRSAEQLSKVELLLIQKLGANHRTDRVTDKLICKLQICTNRMMAQIGELSDDYTETKETVEVDNKPDNEKKKKNEKKKTTVLQFWL